jgi:hypothetical protein
MSPIYPQIDRRTGLTPEAFHREYVTPGRPVVLSGALSAWPAIQRWSPSYFRERCPDLRVRVKDGYIAQRKVTEMRLADYLDLLEADEAERQKDPEASRPPAPYLHDFPLLSLKPDLIADLEPFPREHFSGLYRPKWWEFTQFFLGPANSFTPLHFDCLETQNLSFQVYGQKRWILIPPSEREHCYIYDWRWSKVDADAPDLTAYPAFAKANPMECTIGPGDLLYVPPGTLHQVRGLSVSISFNIDWHTRASALKGVLALARGMPLTNVRYNAAAALGLCLGLPSDAIMPIYRSYLTYVS